MAPTAHGANRPPAIAPPRSFVNTQKNRLNLLLLAAVGAAAAAAAAVSVAAVPAAASTAVAVVAAAAELMSCQSRLIVRARYLRELLRALVVAAAAVYAQVPVASSSD